MGRPLHSRLIRRISRQHATDPDGRSHLPSLMRYVPDALEFLDAGAPEFAAQPRALPNHPVPLAGPLSDLVLDRIERYSKPTNVWRKWREKLARSRDVTVIHGAACTGVLTNAEGTRAAALELRTVSNRRHKVVAATIVLACGGLETPRLLLASAQQPLMRAWQRARPRWPLLHDPSGQQRRECRRSALCRR